MPACNHPHYSKELKKLNFILEYLEEYNKRIDIQKRKVDKEVDYGTRHYNSDNAEQFNSLIINSTLQESLQHKLKSVEKSLSKPYFARVDFKEKLSNKIDNIYIGKMSLLKDEDNEILITDWRAPIANLYYEGRIGKASYLCPEGEIKGDIALKRQYVIENSILSEIYDIDITTNDEFLQASLGASKDSRLKDIVSTIQAEQNKVIRADMWKPLIVQGAAGGGKTTIALHRIAYLLYNHESLSPKNFMIIAPNKFFLSYISEVLPDLGVENVLQSTFEDLAENVIGKKLKLLPSHEKLANFVENSSEKEKIINEEIKAISNFKSSLKFADIIKKYIRDIETSFIPHCDFKIGSFCLLSYEEINKLFLRDYNHLPFMKRIAEIKKHMINCIKLKKDSILDEINYDYDHKLYLIKSKLEDSPKRREAIIKLLDKRDKLLEEIKKSSKTIVNDYIKKINIPSPLECYKNLIYEENIYSKYSNYKELRSYTLKVLEKDYLDLEDLAPLMYLKYELLGLDEKFTVKHILIDEAQDFSLFQLFVLKKIINIQCFTILGDLCQGIHSYRGIKDWNELNRVIFNGESDFMTLEQSYRTTVEIMDAANTVIKNIDNLNAPLAKPVIRHGEPVIVEQKDSIKAVAEDIVEKIEASQKENFKSIAIICKTLKESKALKAELLKLNQKVSMISGNEKEYSGGMVIIPSYLVKGLEFDVVIIANASDNMYKSNELDTKLLYIAMTRALHRLYIYSIEKKSSLLSDIK
ncbi:AAA family ATPase [Clostridium sp. 19966]|uniref:RNA polymerase recycling motor HelD n=1 Tax=Clostridium sp. 19966 TaxID=2768166 RepID=UPI0028DF0D82|nr:RNA polymerase recycling motor HelD [Clostridium sp. 19966]MDT8717196.1 AAA family ATPase [Clostridium sp. 19966]